MLDHLRKLDIYNVAFELMVHVEKCVRHFERYYKYTTGSELRSMCSEILALTAKFNEKEEAERAEFLENLKDKIINVQIKLNICEELNVFRRYESWFRAAELVTNLLGQCERLHNYFVDRQNQGGVRPQ